jgi:hypothetical protein
MSITTAEIPINIGLKLDGEDGVESHPLRHSQQSVPATAS